MNFDRNWTQQAQKEREDSRKRLRTEITEKEELQQHNEDLKRENKALKEENKDQEKLQRENKELKREVKVLTKFCKKQSDEIRYLCIVIDSGENDS